ncbi:unnamed protein product [Cylicostephanus goldi]|uniref:non-specific serine/threonine protein kinase n=1 Tax=Cylicostephanus goldi TaxID=71465 RepID=A0A3P7MIR5_CYLGO|nr:unnamed protein product [Cylicostephanus goldi]
MKLRLSAFQWANGTTSLCRSLWSRAVQAKPLKTCGPRHSINPVPDERLCPLFGWHGGATQIYFGPWVILKKIDEGGFGQVYKVENVATKKVAALKAESNDIEGGSALKLEVSAISTFLCMVIKDIQMTVIRAITADGDKPHIPLEKTLKNLSVKLVHDYGFVHRDIKPNNFVMGYREDYERARLVHILDFGLSRSYAIQSVSKFSLRV